MNRCSRKNSGTGRRNQEGRFLGEQLENRELKTTAMDLVVEPVEPVESAAVFVKFDGIDGESKSEGHKKWSDIVSFQSSPAAPRSQDTNAAAANSFQTAMEPAAAAFVKFDGIDGESQNQDDKRDGWIIVDSFSHPVFSPAAVDATLSLGRPTRS